jgi:hypothetical protein
LYGTAQAEGRTKERVKRLALCPRVETFSVLLVPPSDCDKLDSVQESWIVVLDYLASLVSEHKVP